MNNDTDDNTTCIICLEPNAISINDSNMSLLVTRQCTCSFHIHKNCIGKWINVNPACPYCKKELSFSNNCIIAIIQQSNDNTPLLNNANVDANAGSVAITYSQDNTCVRYVLLIICIFMTTSIIGNLYTNIV